MSTHVVAQDHVAICLARQFNHITSFMQDVPQLFAFFCCSMRSAPQRLPHSTVKRAKRQQLICQILSSLLNAAIDI